MKVFSNERYRGTKTALAKYMGRIRELSKHEFIMLRILVLPNSAFKIGSCGISYILL
jgi:hypothetical protein